jgi:hypothetical protein
MSEKATEILKNVYTAYANGENYTINTPVSSQVHDFNMAINEIKEYIEFLRRDMVKVSMTLTESGLEYCMENFEE